MKLPIEFAKIVGNSSDTIWSQVYVTPIKAMLAEEEEAVGEQVDGVSDERGKFFAVLVVRRKDGEVDVSKVGRELLGKIQKKSVEFEKSRVGESLKEMVSEVVDGVDGVEIELMTGVVEDSRVTLVGVGKGGVLMFRDEGLGWILKGGDKVAQRMGAVLANDKLILGSSKFFKRIDLSLLKGLLHEEKVEEIGEQLASLVHGEGKSDGIVAVVVGVEGVGGKVSVGGEKSVCKGFQERINRRFLDNGLGKRVTFWMEDVKKSKLADRARLVKRKLYKGRYKPSKPEVYLRSPKQRKVTISVALLLLVLLGLSVGLGWKKRVDDGRQAEFRKVYEPAKERLDEAIALKEDNPLRARALIVEAKEILDQGLREIDERSKQHDQIEELAIEADQIYQDIAREWKIDEAEVYFDLGLVREDFFGESMAMADSTLAVLDTSHDVVVSVEVGSKKAKVIGGGDLLKGAELIGASVGRAVVVSDEGIVAIWFGDREPEVLVDREEEWQRLRRLGTFGGNVYLLDAEASELWRYPGFEGGVGVRRRWLGPGVTADFSNTADMVIDGDIWVLDKSGEVSLYRQGAAVRFEIVGLVKQIEEAVAMDTSVESEYIYILDRGNERVLVVDKNGEYKEQYIWGGISGVSDLVVVEEKAMILLLSGTSIYRIPLKT